MFDFLTGFLLGIIFTFAATLFGVYKLLLRLGDGNPKSLPHLQYNPINSVSHSIPKHTLDDIDVNVESCTWLNTVASAMCVEALSSPVLVESLHKKLHDILNKPGDKPDMLGDIVISDINMGNGLPIIDGVRVLSRASDDSLHAEVGLRYTGGASFTIGTEIWMNWPTPKFAALPVSLNASFNHFDGTLTTAVYWRSSSSFRLIVYFRARPNFQLRIGSTIGHSTKLVNVLQVSTLLENLIYNFVNKELVFPNGFDIEVEEGKIVCVRKLASVQRITEKGEPTVNAAEHSLKRRASAPVNSSQHTHAPHHMHSPQHSHAHALKGDLSQRGFTVTG